MKKRILAVVLVLLITPSVVIGFEEISRTDRDLIEITVRKDWTLSEIAEGVGMSTSQLMKMNGLESSVIYPGQDLEILPYSEMKTVKVSWYGPNFQDNTMANGEEFDMHDSSIVAHKWLPFGTRVKLTRVDTGQNITVTIKDRGPYYGSRHFDLSKAAAKKLGMINEGVVRCKVKILS